MRKVDFTISGGFPLEQETLDFMQLNYKDIEKVIVALIGKPVDTDLIIWGIIEDSGSYSDGIILNDLGELVFVTGGVGDKVNFNTNVESATFFPSNQTNPVYYHTIGNVNAINGIDISSMLRIQSIFSLGRESTSGYPGLIQIAALPDIDDGVSNTLAVTPYGLNQVYQPQITQVRNLVTEFAIRDYTPNAQVGVVYNQTRYSGGLGNIHLIIDLDLFIASSTPSIAITLPSGVQSNSKFRFLIISSSSQIIGTFDNVTPNNDFVNIDVSTLGPGNHNISFSVTFEGT